MGEADRTALNTFFGHLAAAPFQEFDPDNYDQNDLISFSLLFNFVFDWSGFIGPDGFIDRTADGYARIAANYIEDTVYRFFGISELNHSIFPDRDSQYYENGVYHQMGFNGPCPLAEVKHFYDNGDGTYTAHYDVYIEYLFDVPPVTEHLSSAIAIVAPHEYNGAQTYRLLRLTSSDSFPEIFYEDDDSWRQLYIDYINDNHIPDHGNPNLGWRYSLFYLNDDNIPELFVAFGFINDGYGFSTEEHYVGTGSGGTMDVIRYGRPFEIFYIERENLMLVTGGRSGSYFNYVYEIRDGKFVRLHGGESTIHYTTEDNSRIELDADGFPVPRHFWDGTEMTASDYRRALENAFDFSRATNVQPSYSYDEIISIIRGA
jgi:hypothetical protein